MVDSLEKPRILIVDDAAANLAVLSEVLGSEYRILAARGGEKALKIASTAPLPDLILLDIMMPGMSGYDVCRRLKADPVTQDIPVIFVTAMHEVEDETTGLELGGVDYVTKPICPPIVKSRVKAHLAVHSHAREMQRMIAKLEAQALELSEWNRMLEHRVAEGVNQLNTMARLKRFFSPPVVDLILSGTAEDPLKSHRREIAAAFVDLRGFTNFTQTTDPEDVMGVFREYHEAMGSLIMAHAGTVERFAGDGIMIFFNDPVEVDNPAARAVKMAIAMQDRFAALELGWQGRGFELGMGIGIALGFATIGTIGFEGRRDYGAVGNVTNLAARLCGEAAGGQILITQRVQGLIADFARTERIGELSLKGFQRPVTAYSVLGHGDTANRTLN